MAEYDNTQKIAPFLDKHLLLQLLDHALEQKVRARAARTHAPTHTRRADGSLPARARVPREQVYDEKQVLQAQLNLLKKTKLIDAALEKHKAIHKTDEVPADMKDLRTNAVQQLKELKADCKQLLTVIEDPALAKMRAEKPSEGKESTKASLEKAFKETLMQLVDKNGIEDAHVDALYKYAKLHYECGNYGMAEGSDKMGAGEYLPIFRILCKEKTGNADGALSALWGKLATDILLEQWDEAFDDVKELRDFVDAKTFRDPLQQLQQRSWILHWVIRWPLKIHYNIHEMYIYTHAYIYANACTSIHMHTHVCAHRHTHTHTCTHIHARAHTHRTHTQTHTHTHTRTRARARARAHTRTREVSSALKSLLPYE